MSDQEKCTQFTELLYGPKDSRTIHYDEDTIPHGNCTDPLHCDCMCPHCWAEKVKIILPATTRNSKFWVNVYLPDSPEDKK